MVCLLLGVALLQYQIVSKRQLYRCLFAVRHMVTCQVVSYPLLQQRDEMASAVKFGAAVMMRLLSAQHVLLEAESMAWVLQHLQCLPKQKFCAVFMIQIRALSLRLFWHKSEPCFTG